MRKIIFLIILLMLLGPAFAQVNIYNKVEFSTKYYPDSKKLNFNPNYSLQFSYKETNIDAYLDIRDGGWRSYLNISNLLGALNVYFTKYYLNIEGTRALFDSLLYSRLGGINGVKVSLNKPIKFTATYIPRQIESDVDFNLGRLTLKIETSPISAKLMGLNIYGLYDKDMLNMVETYVVGAEVSPLSLLNLFFEYGNNSRQWAIGGSLKPIPNLTLSGYYRGDGGYKLEFDLKDIVPKMTLNGAYFLAPDSANYMYLSLALPPQNFGNIDTLYGRYTSFRDYDVFYFRLSYTMGKISNTLRIYKNWNFGYGWFDTTVPLTFEDVVSLSF
uniref:Uncharacterized protein n=1 Tax=Dictyoglomus thermophilum TaxID=14 RepID=A0A7C3MJR5_DICTH